MQMKTTFSTLTLAAMIAAGWSTAALADRGPRDMMPKIDFAAMDTNADGKLSPEELVAMHQKMKAERELDRAKDMVKEFDADGDGFLTGAEMPKGPQTGRMFDRIDTDGDGTISREELDTAGEKMRGRHGGHRGGWGFGMGGDDAQDDN